MNPSLRILFDEHEVIVSAVDTCRQVKSLIESDDQQYEIVVRTLLDFFRSYADRFHHYKEEIILFPEMSKRNPMIGGGIVQEMFEHHETFREMLAQIEVLLNAKQFIGAQQLLEEYTERLLEHIAVENEEVFQIAETLFDEKELEDMQFRFVDCDRELGITKKQALVEAVEKVARAIHISHIQ
jgi:hemerythrin-like domain-containing protein